MKINFLIIMFLLTFCSLKKECESTNSQNTDYDYFIGKKIDLFLKHKKYKKILIIDSKPGKASNLLVLYDNNISIEIYPTRFQHMKEFDPKLIWDIEKFKLEIIKKIKIYDRDQLIKEID